MRTGRPATSNASKELSGSRWKKETIEGPSTAMKLADIPPQILGKQATTMWLAFIAPLAEAGVLLETDRIAATVIADCMGSLFETTEKDGEIIRVEDKERRLLSETLLDFLNAFGLTAKSRESMGIKTTIAPKSR